MLEDMPESEGGKFEYQPGGRGIHRDRDMDDDDQPAPKRRFGGEYKAKVCINHLSIKSLDIGLSFTMNELLCQNNPSSFINLIF